MSSDILDLIKATMHKEGGLYMSKAGDILSEESGMDFWKTEKVESQRLLRLQWGATFVRFERDKRRQDWRRRLVRQNRVN